MYVIRNQLRLQKMPELDILRIRVIPLFEVAGLLYDAAAFSNTKEAADRSLNAFISSSAFPAFGRKG